MAIYYCYNCKKLSKTARCEKCKSKRTKNVTTRFENLSKNLETELKSLEEITVKIEIPAIAIFAIVGIVQRASLKDTDNQMLGIAIETARKLQKLLDKDSLIYQTLESGWAIRDRNKK